MGGGWEKGTLGKQIPCQLSETRFPCTRARVDSLKLLLFICEKSAGGRRWRRFGSLSRNIHERRYVEEILLCLFFRLFVCSPNYSLFSEKKWGEGEIGKFNPFRFFSPFPQVNLSIGRFRLLSNFPPPNFLSFFKICGNEWKVENENFGENLEGTRSNHRLIEIRGYSCDPSIFALRINRKLGRGWVAIVASSFRPLASTLSLGESCACFC